MRYHEPLLLAAAAAGWLHAGRFDASVTLAVPPPARARSDKASSTDVSLDGAGDITLTELASERFACNVRLSALHASISALYPLLCALCSVLLSTLGSPRIRSPL